MDSCLEDSVYVNDKRTVRTKINNKMLTHTNTNIYTIPSRENSIISQISLATHLKIENSLKRWWRPWEWRRMSAEIKFQVVKVYVSFTFLRLAKVSCDWRQDYWLIDYLTNNLWREGSKIIHMTLISSLLKMLECLKSYMF